MLFTTYMGLVYFGMLRNFFFVRNRCISGKNVLRLMCILDTLIEEGGRILFPSLLLFSECIRSLAYDSYEVGIIKY